MELVLVLVVDKVDDGWGVVIILFFLNNGFNMLFFLNFGFNILLVLGGGFGILFFEIENGFVEEFFLLIVEGKLMKVVFLIGIFVLGCEFVVSGIGMWKWNKMLIFVLDLSGLFCMKIF